MVINNQDVLFRDKIAEAVKDQSTVRICTDYFSFNGLFDLIGILQKCKWVEILINDQIHLATNSHLFVHDPKENETHLRLETFYRLNQEEAFIRSNIKVRKGKTGGNSFMIIDQVVFQFAPHSLTETTLGIIKDGNPYMITMVQDPAGSFSTFYEQLWSLSIDSKQELITQYQKASPLVSPEQVYHFSIGKIFENAKLDHSQEDRLSKTGFKESVVWNMLYNFQQDAVLGAIGKIEAYNGCIIADSVGLGKTFEALAIIKYDELRNDRVLVLAPKKLRDNWITYRLNDKRNILVRDRLNFDVLNHTDLSRENGMSGDINLETVHWGNYDLLVIDESHNFRNNNPVKGKVSRYEKLMEEVIRKGVSTKVLMLSATPVNTRLNDLKNQLAFITENNDQALENEGVKSIEITLSQAQRKFNRWLEEINPSREGLINSLNGDYFKLLDILTIARSRKHIEKYYDVSVIGRFPTRLKPISVYSDFDIDNREFSITDLNDDLELLNLKFYSPMYFVMDHKIQDYAKKYDTKTKSGSIFTQLDREESIITLMRVNLLKRLESSIHSFRITLGKLLSQIEGLLDKIDENRDFDADLNILDFDFDDDQLEDLFVGGKVKVLLQDLDLVKFREFLHADRAIIQRLLDKCVVISKKRDKKLWDLKKIIRDKIEHPINPGNKKVIVFSAFADTVKYLYEHCAPLFQEEYGVYAGIVTGSDVIKTNLESCRYDLNNILINFAPLAKDREAIFPEADTEIDLLFCTDCISEGQNLQDCDYLINYDIHWNPVRIIQRFGRIDRIGTTNTQIQLVNFYPHLELDQYIDLIQRVKGRMQILDISATGDDNVIDGKAGKNQELDYRKKQLEKMKETVVDIEDLEGGISITDLTFNDFKIDADRIPSAEQKNFKHLASGVFSLSANIVLDNAAGVLFCLRDRNTRNHGEKLRTNLLYPYSVVYISIDGQIQIPSNLGKKSLDLFKKLAKGGDKVSPELLKEFNMETKSGKYMHHYASLVNRVVDHLTGMDQQVREQSIFNPAGSMIARDDAADEYEVISYLIVRSNNA